MAGSRSRRWWGTLQLLGVATTRGGRSEVWKSAKTGCLWSWWEGGGGNSWGKADEEEVGLWKSHCSAGSLSWDPTRGQLPSLRSMGPLCSDRLWPVPLASSGYSHLPGEPLPTCLQARGLREALPPKLGPWGVLHQGQQQYPGPSEGLHGKQDMEFPWEPPGSGTWSPILCRNWVGRMTHTHAGKEPRKR